MRVVLLAFLLCVPCAYAIGLAVPEEIDGRQVFLVDDPVKIQFVVKGDAKEHRIEFYVAPEKDALVVSDKEKSGFVTEWSKFVDIDPYEKVVFDIWFKGREEEDSYFDVRYGFRNVDDVDEGDMGFRQVTESSFEAKVRCNGCGGSSGSGSSSGSSKSSGSGSGGGGGGSAAPASVSFDDVEEVEEVSAPSRGEGAVVVEDIAGEGGGVDQVVVPVSLAERARVDVQPMKVASASVEDDVGRLVAVVLLGLLVTTCGLTAVVRQAVRGQEDG